MAVDEDPENHEGAALGSAAVSFVSQRVLEIGCGDGRLTRRYAAVADSVIAIDPDETAIARLATDLPTVEARPVSIEDLALPDGSVDVVLFAWSL